MSLFQRISRTVAALVVSLWIVTISLTAIFVLMVLLQRMGAS